MDGRSNGKPRIRRAGVAAAAAILTLGLTGAPRAGAIARHALATSGIGFSSPAVVDPVHAYGEPDVRISADDGRVYASGPWGTGTQRSIWNISADGGRTFRPRHNPPITTAAQSDSQIPCPVPAAQCVGGGDTELSIDDHGLGNTGTVYYADLAALEALKTATWDDATKTMGQGVYTSSDPDNNGIDRQWFATWDPAARPSNYTGPLPVNYLIYLEVAGTGEGAAYSTDGLNYTGPTESVPIGLDGNIAVDQQTGDVLEAAGLTGLSDIGLILYSRDPGNPGDPALTKSQTIPIATLPAETDARGLFPVIAMDSARNAYVTWVTRASGHSASEDPDYWQIWYSHASAATGWTQWSTPLKISSGPAAANVMPWITAGAAGRIAIVYYGTADATDDPSQTDAHQPWFVYANVITGADTSAPSLHQIQVTRHPNHYGTICLEGTGCIAVQGNRNMADFFQDGVDPATGALEIVYNDTSNQLLQADAPPPVQTLDHPGAPAVMLVKQNRGISMFGTKVTGPPATGTAMKDPSGDALFDPVYGPDNVPELDIRVVRVRSSGANVVIDLGTSSLADLGHALTATGAGAVDFVVRWIGQSVDDPVQGLENPIYYAAVEALPGGVTQAFAGTATSIDLCSVSACDPHVVDYGGPGNGGTAVSATLKHGPGFDYWEIVVPRTLVGNPADGSLLESLSAFTFARKQSASIQIPNADAEAGITPVQVDGVCCVEARLGP